MHIYILTEKSRSRINMIIKKELNRDDNFKK